MAIIPNQLKIEMAQAFFGQGSYKISLHTSALVGDIDADNFFSDVDAEVVGDGYVAGGGTLTAPVIVKDNVNDWVMVDWDDFTFEGVTIPEIRYAVIYKDLGDPAVSPIIAILDFGSNQAVVANNFIVQFNAAGALRVA